uniref:Uncharacterized protein n=1 Tax=Parascaris univalens TaxID=6257 RepID=A0A914ZLQ0_PARUN
MRITIVEILFYVCFTCASANFPSTEFSLKLREVKRVDVVLKSFVEPIAVVLNTTANVALYGSFCESKQGKAIYLGDGSITKQLSSLSLYEFARSTKCDNDVDPFYESMSGTSRSFYLTVVGKSTRVANVSLSVDSEWRREQRSEHAVKPLLSEHFDILEDAIKTIRFTLRAYEAGLEIVTTFDEGVETNISVYLSFCYDFRGELIENITSYSSPCSIYLNASEIIKLAEKTKCPNEGEPIYDDPLRASRNLFIRFVSTSGGATGHIDVFNGDETLDINVSHADEVVLNGTFESVPQNETRTLEGSVFDIKKGVEIHLNVAEGLFEVTASFCDSKVPLLHGNYAVGKWTETMNEKQLENAVEVGKCIKKEKRSIDKSEYEVSPYILHVSLLGRAARNSATIYALNEIKPVEDMHHVSSESFWDNINIWGYFAIAIVLFVVTALTLILLVFAYRRFCPHDPMETINAYTVSR